MNFIPVEADDISINIKPGEVSFQVTQASEQMSKAGNEMIKIGMPFCVFHFFKDFRNF